MSSPRRPRPSTSATAPATPIASSSSSSSSHPTTPTTTKSPSKSTSSPKKTPSSTVISGSMPLSASKRTYAPAISSPLKFAPLSSSPLRFQVERSPRVISKIASDIAAGEGGDEHPSPSSGLSPEEGGGGGIADEDEERVEEALLADEHHEKGREAKRSRMSGRGSLATTGGTPGAAEGSSSPRKSVGGGVPTKGRKSRASLADAAAAPPSLPPPSRSTKDSEPDEMGVDESLDSVGPSTNASVAQELISQSSTSNESEGGRLGRLQRGLERFLGLLDGKSSLEHFSLAFPTLDSEEIEPIRAKFVEDIKELIKSGHHSLIESYDLLDRLPLLERLCVEADRRADRGLPLDHEEMKDVFRPDLDISTALNAKALKGRRERVELLEEQLREIEANNAVIHAQLQANMLEADEKQGQAKAFLDAMDQAIRELKPDPSTDKQLRSTLEGLASELGPRV